MTLPFTFQDRVALVTGGASGVGLGIATALLRRGALVVIGDIRPDHMAKAQATLAAYGERVLLQQLDVSSKSDWEAARLKVTAHFGDLHILCLNAGIGVLGTILQARPHDWAWLMNVNLRGVTLGLETFLPHMRRHGKGGRICATSSMGGLMVANDGGIYSSAKFGVVALMECLREDLAAEQIGVTVLCPAAVNTNIHDHTAMRPSEFADSGLSSDPAEQAKMAEMARSILSLGADPLQVGERVADALAVDQPYVFTDSAVSPILAARRDALLAAAK
jgi:NAD(P)-dependent dehydrogenase (short-subunit alcohol dehydrogenase family)